MGIIAPESWPKHPFLHHNPQTRTFILEPKQAVAKDILDALTPRQREIIEYIAEGLTREHIAEILDSSPHLVKRMMYAQMSVEGFSGAAERVGSVQIAVAALGVFRGADKKTKLPDINQLVCLFDMLHQIDDVDSFTLGLSSYGLKGEELQLLTNLNAHGVKDTFKWFRELFGLPEGISQNVIIEKYAYLLTMFYRPEVSLPVLTHKYSAATLVGTTIRNAILKRLEGRATP